MIPESLDYVRFLSSIDPEKATIIQSMVRPQKVKKNTYLLREGQICQFSYIISQGVAKKYINFAEKEVVTDIYLAGDIAFSFESFTHQTLSTESIVAVTDLEMLCFSRSEYFMAKSKYPWFVEFDSQFMERYIVQLDEKMKELATLNAAQRYKKILNHYPKLLQEVPLKVIASFLQISVERLSRIRAKMKDDSN